MHNRIRNLREDNDISQKQMASILNVGQTTYSDYELAKINIPIAVLKKLAIYFNTSIDYLLELTDNPVPYDSKDKKLWYEEILTFLYIIAFINA